MTSTSPEATGIPSSHFPIYATIAGTLWLATWLGTEFPGSPSNAGLSVMALLMPLTPPDGRGWLFGWQLFYLALTPVCVWRDLHRFRRMYPEGATQSKKMWAGQVGFFGLSWLITGFLYKDKGDGWDQIVSFAPAAGFFLAVQLLGTAGLLAILWHNHQVKQTASRWAGP